MGIRSSDLPADAVWINVSGPLDPSPADGRVVLLCFSGAMPGEVRTAGQDARWVSLRHPEHVFSVIIVLRADGTDVGSVERQVSEAGISNPVVVDISGSVCEMFAISDVPAYVLIGVKGRVIGTTYGHGKLWMIDQAIREAVDDPSL